MFITYKRAEIASPPLFGEDYQMWRFVELEEHRPWFYVMVNRRQKATAWRTMLLIPTEEELENMLERRGAETQIEAVQVMLPGRINGTTEWQMERLVELVRVYDQNERISGYDFKTASGNTYSERSCVQSQDTTRYRIYCSSTG